MLGGWKVVAFRTDVRYPIDKSQIAAVEASITKSIAMHEFSTLFPDDPAKAQAQAKLRKAASEMESTKRIAEVHLPIMTFFLKIESARSQFILQAPQSRHKLYVGVYLSFKFLFH